MAQEVTMDSTLALAERRLLAPGGLATGDLDRVFSQLMGPSIDAADLYFQHSRSESWVLEEGIVKDGNHSIEQGVGVRAMSGEKTGFSYSDDIVLPQLLEALHVGSQQQQLQRYVAEEVREDVQRETAKKSRLRKLLPMLPSVLSLLGAFVGIPPGAIEIFTGWFAQTGLGESLTDLFSS